MTWPKTSLPLIAILRGIQPQEAEAHLEALLEAGFDTIEIPLNTPRWEESLPNIIQTFKNRALLGAGTVLRPEEVDTLARMGCKLIVTPNTHPEVIRRGIGHGMIVCAGCATPTEALAALEAGAHALKFFPAMPWGPSYIKAVRTILPPETSVFAVGGVTPENLSSWLEVGCVGAGLGSELYRADQPLSRTQTQAKAFVEAYKSFKKQRGAP